MTVPNPEVPVTQPPVSIDNPLEVARFGIQGPGLVIRVDTDSAVGDIIRNVPTEETP